MTANERIKREAERFVQQYGLEAEDALRLSEAGYVLPDGRLLDRNDYPELYGLGRRFSATTEKLE